MRKCQVYPVLYVKRKYHLSATSLYRKISCCVPVALTQLEAAFVIRDFLICLYAEVLRVQATLEVQNKELDYLILTTKVRLRAVGVNVDGLKY